MTEVPLIPPGNQAFTQAMSRSSTPGLSEPASPSPVQRLPPPLAFLAETFSDTRDNLQLDPTLVPNLTPQALHTISAGEGSTMSILCATVSGIVAITNQLDTVSTQLAALAKENKELRNKLHDISSILANEVASAEDLEELPNSVHDLSHRVSAPKPTAHAPLAAPAPPAQRSNQSGPQSQARPSAPTGPSTTTRQPAPTAPTPAPHEQTSAAPATLDPSVHCPYYNSTLKKMFGNPELYARAFPHSWEAGQFRAGKYHLSILHLPPSTLNLDQNSSLDMLRRPAPPGPPRRARENRPPLRG